MHRHDLKKTEAGDLSKRIQLKKDLKCKSFRWYLENIFRGQKYIYDKNVTAYGFVRNPKSNLCLDILNRNEEKTEPLGVFSCSPRGEDSWTNQVFSLTKSGELRREETCAIANLSSGKVEMGKCIDLDIVKQKKKKVAYLRKKKQLWIHEKGGQIINMATKECMTAKKLESMDDIKLEPCDKNDLSQIWWFQTYSDLKVY